MNSSDSFWPHISHSNWVGHDYRVVINAGCISGSIRIVGGTVPWEGRVEVCKTQTWGTVCDTMWNQEDSSVACRQAGFSREGN